LRLAVPMPTPLIPPRLAASAASLLTASVLAGLLNLAALPVIARIYHPGVMGVGVVFLALHSFLVVIVTGRYTLAIPLPRRHLTARYLSWLVGALAVVSGLVIAPLAYLLRWPIASALQTPELAHWLPFLGLTVCAAALSEAVDYGLIRKRRFKAKALLGFSQALVTIACLLLLGWLHEASVTTFMTAQIAGICGAALLATAARQPAYRPALRWKRMLKVAVCYRHLPKHLLTTGVLNAGSTIALPLAISAFSGPAMVALYSVSAQLVGRPISMISSAIWQVVYGQLGNASASAPQTRLLLRRIYTSTSLLYSVPVIGLVAFPDVATHLLGHKWQDAGAMMQVFVVMAYFQYASNSVSYFQSFGRYAAESFVNMGLIVLRFGALIAAAALGLDGYHTVVLFCVVSAVLYLGITAYWSRLLGLGLALPLQGLLTFATAYAISLLALELFANPLLRFLLIGGLLAGVGYVARHRILDSGAHAEPQS
jgi:O-antigen/teichoic acid export membrane protein